MSIAHLTQLRDALTRRGWDVTERMRGDDNVQGAATWEVQRRGARPTLLIDFDGFGGMGEDIPLDQSGACQVRGHPIHLYFYRVNRSRGKWLAKLDEFVSSLDRIESAQRQFEAGDNASQEAPETR